MSERIKKISIISDTFILFDEIAPSLHPRGSNILLWNVIKSLLDNYQIDFEIYQFGKKDSEKEFNNIKIVTLQSDSFDQYKEKLGALSFDSDILHYNNIDLVSSEKNIITTATIHTNAFLEKESAKERLLECSSFFNKIVVVNDGYVDRYNELGNKIRLIKNGVPLDTFRFSNKKQIYESHISILFPNLNSPKKNRDFAVELIKELNKGEKRYNLILTGESEILDLDNDMYEFVGQVNYGSDMQKLYHSCDITIVPSISESCSLCSLESMACGTVVIANDIEGVSSYIIDNISGFLVSTGNIQDWVLTIKRLVNNPKEYYEIARNARNIMEKEYNSERMATDYYKMWINLIEGKDEKM